MANDIKEALVDILGDGLERNKSNLWHKLQEMLGIRLV